MTLHEVKTLSELKIGNVYFVETTNLWKEFYYRNKPREADNEIELLSFKGSCLLLEFGGYYSEVIEENFNSFWLKFLSKDMVFCTAIYLSKTKEIISSNYNVIHSIQI